jgi:hypothetical protein
VEPGHVPSRSRDALLGRGRRAPRRRAREDLGLRGVPEPPAPDRQPNDDFADAQPLSGPSGALSGSNANATAQPAEPAHHGDSSGRSVWYRWTAPASGRAVLATAGSSFDTILAVYTGMGVESLTYVASNDDVHSADRQSRVAFEAHAGSVYAIAVIGREGVTGTIRLRWWMDSEPPETFIDSGPANVIAEDFALFELSSNEDDVSFECVRDGGSVGACTARHSYRYVGEGDHVLEVRARDAAGNLDPTPAVWRWRVAPPPPPADSNLYANGSFESGLTGWRSYNGTLALVSGGPVGVQAAKVTSTVGTSFTVYPSPRPVSPTSAGVVYVARAWVRSNVAGRQACLKVREWSAAGAVVAQVQLCLTAGAAWQQFPELRYTTRAGGGSLDSYVSMTGGAGTSFEVDGILLSAGAPPPADTTPPETTISSGPSGATRSTSATFAFAASESATFECQLDNAAYARCTSPANYSGLTAGVHVVRVRAADGAGNVDPTPATRSWTVDLSEPDTTISTGPSGTTAETAATFAFAASETAASFECRLDNAAFAACTSPKQYSGLGPGAHVFDVRATDAAGNIDPTPATRTWTVASADTTPPETTITGGPSGSTTATSATFTFTASDSASFECRLDSAPWSACVSPSEYSGLTSGTHSFAVRATDQAGNTDGTPAIRSWTIEPAPPSGSNLYANGSFENGLTGWRSWNGALSAVTGGVDGPGAARAATNGSSSFSIYPSPRPVQTTVGGTVYAARAWARSAAPGKTVCLKVREWSSSGAVVTQVQACVTTTGSWQQFPELRYTTAQSGGALESYVSISGAVAGDSVDIDAMTLRPV